jgi:hypothetical protein
VAVPGVPVVQASEYEVMALAELGAVPLLLLLLPHPATKAASINAMNHISGLVKLSNLFILFLLCYLIQKTSVQSTEFFLVLVVKCYANIR